MGNRPATAGRTGPVEGSVSEPCPGDGSDLAYLAQARCLLLTTFKRSGTPVSTPVHGVADGDRAYFRAWSRSGTVQRLRRTGGAAQVVPCGALGLCSYGPPLAATVRPLAGGEAAPVARKLARKYPVRERLVVSPLQWAGRWRMLHFELVVEDAAASQAAYTTAGYPPARSAAAEPTGTGWPVRADS